MTALRRKARRMRYAGVPPREIAAVLDVHVDNVWKLCAGILGPERADRDEHIVEAASRGLPPGRVAEEVGCSDTTVRTVLRRDPATAHLAPRARGHVNGGRDE